MLWSIIALFGVIECFLIALYLESRQRISVNNALVRIGSNTMCIYLFHNPIQVVIRTIAWRYLCWPYWITVALKFVCGLFGSILIQKILVDKIRLLRFLFYGEMVKK